MATINSINNTIPDADFTVIARNLYIGTATPGNPYDLAIERSVAGLIGSSMQNISNNASAGVNMQLIVEPATADPFILYSVNGAATWSAGMDNSDSDAFKITTGSSPSAGTEVFNAATSGNVTMNGGIVNIGTNSADNAINIGTAASAGRTVTIGNSTGTSSVAINSGTGGVTVGTSANAHTTTIGSTNSTSATTIQSGSGALNITSTNGALTINSGTGVLEISTDASATTVSFATGGAVKTVTLGSTNTTSSTAIRSGSGGITLTGAVTSANAITITNGALTLTAGNLIITSATTSTVGQIKQSGTAILHTFGGTSNIFVGSGAGNFTLTATSATGIGLNALSSLTSGIENTAIGDKALDDVASGARNTAVGNRAAENILGNNNVAIGSQALQGAAGATSETNVAIGYLALRLATSCIWNVAAGSQAMENVTTGSENVAVGQGALGTITTGNYNVAIGFSAGSSLTVGDSSNISINAGGTAGSNNTLFIGAATGTGTQQLNRSFIHGIRGITTGNADAIAVLVDSAGQLGTVSSSIRYKENIQDLQQNHILKLRPVSFNYKQDGRKATGLIAEEVEQIMPELVAYNQEGLPESVKYHELPVLLLDEIKKLEKRIRELEKEVRAKLESFLGDY